MPTAGSPGRVLMTADGVGGVWQYALDLGSALVRDGSHVTLAVMGPPLQPDQRAHAASLDLTVVEGDYRLEWMDDPWDDVAAASGWLLDLERTVRPDVVHLNGYCHAALPWSVPAVVVAHSCVRTWWRGVHGEAAPPEWERYTREVARGLRAAALVAAPSAAMLDGLRAEYGEAADGWVIPNGSSSLERLTYEPASKEPVVFAAGRIWDPAKNIEALCAAAADVRWPVCVAGATDEGSRQCESTPGVRYLGRLPQARMDRWFERASIYVLPARYEPFGLSVLEAAAAGCALILGDIPSLRENWSDAAEFVHPDDHGALAAAVNRLAGDAVRRDELGRRAAARAGAFTVERMAAGYRAAYARAGVGALT